MTDPITIGDLTFQIDDSKGTVSERESFARVLTQMASIPVLQDALTGLVHTIPDAKVTLTVSSIIGEVDQPGGGNFSFLEDGTLSQVNFIEFNPELLDQLRYKGEDGQFHELNMAEFIMNELAAIVAIANPESPYFKDPSAFPNDGPAEQFSAAFENIIHRALGKPDRVGEGDGTYDWNGQTTSDPSSPTNEPVFPDDQTLNEIKDNTSAPKNSIMNLPTEFRQILADFQQVILTRDPLMIDMNDDGYLSPYEAAGIYGVYFDIDADGIAEAMPWVRPEDGLLVLDRNGDGIINDGTELFGDVTRNGFEALSELDFNNDGVMDANDPAWHDLQVWQDFNSDGFSQADELFSMEDLGFQSIDIPASGNFNSSTITTDSGDGSLSIVNKNYPVDERNTRYAGDVDIDFSTLFLPELRGFSTLADLRIAMSLDNEGADSLLADAQGLASQSLPEVFENMGDFRNDFDLMLFKWAGVENIDPSSRGVFMEDARQLEFLEEYFGSGFFQARFPDENPQSLAAEQLMDVFDTLRDDLMADFIYQAGGAKLFETDGAYSLATDSISFGGETPVLDVAALNDLGLAAINVANALEFWANVAFFIEEIRGDLESLTQAEIDALNDAIFLSDPDLTWDMVKEGYQQTDDLTLTGTENADILDGALGNDTITGLGGDDILRGSVGDDLLDGGDGNDLLLGGNGVDHIMGGAGNDILRDGSGSDLIEGGTGDDVYVWEGGLADFIFDAGGYDVIRVFNPNNIIFERNFTDDLVLRIGNSTLTLQDQLRDPSLFSTIEEIQDNDGNTIFDMSDFTGRVYSNGTEGDDTLIGVEFGGSVNDYMRGHEGDDTLLGGKGDDTLFGNEGDDSLHGWTGDDLLIGDDAGGYGNDFLDAGLGDDVVMGGRGNDTYLFTGGHDTYFDAGHTDTIVFADGIALNDLSIFRQITGRNNGEYDLHIELDDKNSILIENYFNGGPFEYLRFSDGSTFKLSNKDDFTTYGTDGGNTITGVGDDTIYAMGGNDTIQDDWVSTSSVWGSLVVSVDAGNDFIDAGGGNDVISLWGGTDTVLAGSGDDTVWLRTYGNIRGNNIDGGDGNDTLNVSFMHSKYAKNGFHVDLDEGFVQKINSITGELEGPQDTLTSIENAIGTEMDDVLIGNSADNILDGWRGNDTMEAGSGNDTYFLSDGIDTIYDDSGIDTLKIDRNDWGGNISVFDNISFSRSGDDLVLSMSENDQTTITDFYNGHAIEELQMVQINGVGNEIVEAVLDLSNIDLWITGTSGDDVLIGTENADTIVGLKGVDTVYALDGNDTIYGGEGGDIIYGGLGDDWIYGGDDNDQLFGDEGNDYIIGGKDVDLIDGGDGSDYIENLNSGGNTINGGAGDDTIISTGINTINGGEGNDYIEGMGTVDGGVGNDTLIIGASNYGSTVTGGDGDDLFINEIYRDTLIGGNGNDTFMVGQAGATINGGSGYDIADYSEARWSIQFRANADFWTGRELVSFNGNSGGTYLSGVEEIVGSDFDDTFLGAKQTEVFRGGTGNDYFYGKGGHDQLYGGDGSDVYFFELTSTNQDYIFDSVISDTGGRMDTIDFGNITLPEIVMTEVGDDLEITFISYPESKITIEDQYIEGHGIEYLEFYDGTRVQLVEPPPNNPPVAQDDHFETSEGEIIEGNVLDDNGNGADYEPDGEGLGITPTTMTTANGGTVEILSNGDFTYTPADNFFGEDSFDYTLLDSFGGSSIGTVSIFIEGLPFHNPVAENDLIEAFSDQTTMGNVLANNGFGEDFDADGDPLSVAPTTMGTAQGGIVEIFEDGDFTYTPLTGFTGQDYFDYTLLDGSGGNDRGTVMIEVVEPNATPDAQDDEFTATPDAPLSGNLLADNGNGVDSDPDGDALHVFAETVTTVQGGTVTIYENGDFTYTTAEGFAGVDSFNYILLDDRDGVDFGHVDITVPSNRAPEAQDDFFGTDEDVMLTDNVLANDSDPDGDALTVTNAGTFMTANGGTVVLTESGDLTYTPAENYYGSDSFDYTVSDLLGLLSHASVNITIAPVNDNPVAQNDAFTTAEDTALTGNVLVDNGNGGADSDVDGDSLSVQAGAYMTENGGVIVMYEDGMFAYLPAENYNGHDSFEYTIVDGQGGQAKGLIEFDVTPVNDAPEAQDDNFTVNEDTVLTGNVLADNGNGADSDVDGDQLRVEAATISTVAGGTVVLLENGEFTYTPAENYYGADSFEYTLSDGNGLSDTATASINVLPVNDAPEPANDYFEATVDMPLSSGNVLLNDSDIENDPLSVIAGIFDTQSGGEIEFFEDGTFIYMPEFGFYGTDSVQYMVTDGQDTSLASVTFNVDFLDTDIVGTEYDDVLRGTQGPDRLFGLDGNDTLDGKAGIDWINGMGGDDYIKGRLGNDVLIGGDGDDEIVGNGGDDVFYGGNGSDTLFGGNGFDTFIFREGETGIDTIKSFGQEDGDALDISDLLQNFDPLADAISDFVLISQGNNNDSILSVDADGGGDSFVTIAILDGLPDIPDAQTLLEKGNLIV